MTDLVKELQSELQSRRGEWKLIAENVPGASYSWISKVGRGKYTSSPSYERIVAVLSFLKGLRGRPLVDARVGKAA
jgi:hypothetical protein